MRIARQRLSTQEASPERPALQLPADFAHEVLGRVTNDKALWALVDWAEERLRELSVDGGGAT